MPINTIRWKKLINEDQIRLVVGRPRRIPRHKRMEIAAILSQELIGSRPIVDMRRHAARYGAFHIALRAMQETDEWGKLRGMASKSDIMATLALRQVTATMLDILDRSICLPAEDVGQQSLISLIELTLLSWRRRGGGEELAMGVEECIAADGRGHASAALREAFHERLGQAIDEMQTYMDMLAKMKELLPAGGDEAALEEAFFAYFNEVDLFSELLRRNEELQQIIDLMGKLDMKYGGVREEMRSFVTSEAYELGASKDIPHALPIELLKLKVPILRTLFFSQMLEGQLLTYRLRGLDWRDELGRKGPVIALIDASGSMSGEPELIAKAFILMLARRMEREKRDIKIILFAAEDWKLELDMTDKGKAAKSLLDTICRHFEGDTDFNSAIRTGLDTLEEETYRGADVLFLTDGESRVTDEEVIRRWSELKNHTGSRIFTLILGSDEAGGLEKISDKTWTLPATIWGAEQGPSDIIHIIAEG